MSEKYLDYAGLSVFKTKLEAEIPNVSGKEDTSNKVTSISSSSTDTQYPSAKLLYDQLALKQGNLTAGSNITISNGTISATDTTYSTFTGTNGSAAGTSGLVPGPATTDTGKYLKSDGTWAVAPGTTYTAGTRITIDANDNNKISTTAEINAIDTVKVDGTALTITSKSVNITGKENTSNKVTSLTSSSTDTQYPSAKCVFDYVAAKISSAYKAKGSCTFANKPALSADHEGEVWNITDAFTTTSDFVEGAGNTYPAGTNIVVVNTAASGQTAVYKYDVLAGFIDLSSYMLKTDMVAITTAEINALFS